jgi:hypothetical protein
MIAQVGVAGCLRRFAGIEPGRLPSAPSWGNHRREPLSLRGVRG